MRALKEVENRTNQWNTNLKSAITSITNVKTILELNEIVRFYRNKYVAVTSSLRHLQEQKTQLSSQLIEVKQHITFVYLIIT